MIPMNGRLKLTNFVFTDNSFDADFEILSYNTPSPNPVIPPVDIPPPPLALPLGYDNDINVGYSMLKSTVAKHKMNAVAYQNHGKEICDNLNLDWPGLNAYAHNRTDAVMWPGHGSLDVTVDSGKGNSAFPDGWYFNPDGHNKYGEGR